MNRILEKDITPLGEFREMKLGYYEGNRPRIMVDLPSGGHMQCFLDVLSRPMSSCSEEDMPFVEVLYALSELGYEIKDSKLYSRETGNILNKGVIPMDNTSNNNVTEVPEASWEKLKDEEGHVLFIVPNKEDLKKDLKEGEAEPYEFDKGNLSVDFHVDDDGDLVFSVYRKEGSEKIIEKVVEKIVTKEVPVEKIVEKPVPVSDRKPAVLKMRLNPKRAERPVQLWADIQLGTDILYDLRLVKSVRKPGTFFVGYPQYKDRKTGNWYNRFRISKEEYNAVNAAILEAGTKLLESNPVSAPQTPATPATSVKFTESGYEITAKAEEIQAALYERKGPYMGNEIRPYKGGACYGFDKDGFRFMTQNPNTGSDSAKLAQAGNKLIWIFRDGQYWGKIYNGKFERVS